jgi:hypothetical protein
VVSHAADQQQIKVPVQDVERLIDQVGAEDIHRKRVVMAKRQEFRVTLDSADLNSETVDRLSHAIQRAAMSELATLDLKGDLAARILSGPTRGLQVAILDPQRTQQLGFEEVAE